MSIIPGTTPTLTLALDASVTGCTAAEFCLVCENVRILRSLPELSVSADGTEVSVRLTQSETLSLPDNHIAKVQLRVMRDGTVFATDAPLSPAPVLTGTQISQSAKIRCPTASVRQNSACMGQPSMLAMKPVRSTRSISPEGM